MLTQADIDAFREWIANPLPAYAERERCTECNAPALVTLTVDGKTVRACERHVASLNA